MKSFGSAALTAALLVTAIACNHNNEALDDSSSLKRNLNPEAITVNESSPSHVSSEGENKNKYQQTRGNQVADTTTAPQRIPPQQSVPGGKAIADWDKKIIKTASINLEVKNYKSFSGIMRDNIKKFGGYTAQEEQSQTDYKIENTVSIKVPVDQFDNLAAELTKGEDKIIEKKITSEDVTSDIVDTKSRVEAKKQVRLRYLDLLKQARNMQDILNVQNEINSIQEDIETAAGRIEYLSHSSAYSTINLTYFQVLDASAKDTAEPSFGTKVWQSFRNGWNWIGDVLVGIISIWPLLFLGFACWFAYKKWLGGKMQKRNA